MTLRLFLPLLTVLALMAAVPNAWAISSTINDNGGGVSGVAADGVCDADTVTAGNQSTLRKPQKEAASAPSADVVSNGLASGAEITLSGAIGTVANPVTIDGC